MYIELKIIDNDINFSQLSYKDKSIKILSMVVSSMLNFKAYNYLLNYNK